MFAPGPENVSENGARPGQFPGGDDRLSFQNFIGWTLADKVTAGHTLWDFREALITAGLLEKLFALFDEQWRERGLLAHPGKLVDASFVDVPRQRNSREENAPIKGGGTLAEWAEQPAKQRQSLRCFVGLEPPVTLGVARLALNSNLRAFAARSREVRAEWFMAFCWANQHYSPMGQGRQDSS